MVTVEFGEVKFYKPDRGFGFMFVLDQNGGRTGEELFFHITNRRGVAIFNGDTDFTWFDGIPLESGGISEPLDDPCRRDMVVFIRSAGYKGDVVKCWSYTALWHDCVARQPRFRLVEILHSPSRAKPILNVLFEGRVQDLSRECPRTSARMNVMEIGKIRVSSRIEMQDEHGIWHECTDPRPFIRQVFA